MVELSNDEASGEGELTIRVIAMPSNTNPAGDIFGGWLVSQMDLAAGSTAALRARGRCATVAIDSLVFHRPVAVGDEVSIRTRLLKIGRPSMTIDVQAWRRMPYTTEIEKVTQGSFVFVALDEFGRSRSIDAAPA
ncbi:acyl-CoA thioesterase [Acetobacter sp. AN02]|uniref:acyl-CoA thioesterase n=1 Tax=Acetobacter sp. AN02 TaxID=2894186 RepID=UPI0024344B16|nr:acyl-CoA thioesterase [Acetobacter sp. AN02]MDG6095154.1 acyl-CoA thioesterase [Acetobacter sp. AN02]